MKKEFKTIWGKVLDRNDQKKRIKRYIKESLIFTAAMGVLDVIAIFITKNNTVFYFVDNYVINFITTVIVTMIILLITSFGFNYFISERVIKKTK